jgi:hypothetical protein
MPSLPVKSRPLVPGLFLPEFRTSQGRTARPEPAVSSEYNAHFGERARLISIFSRGSRRQHGIGFLFHLPQGLS